jgi:hypothetical protein
MSIVVFTAAPNTVTGEKTARHSGFLPPPQMLTQPAKHVV